MKRKQNNRKQQRLLDLGEVTAELVGESVDVEGLVDRIAQTGGPTLFSIIDGTGTLILKGFESPGERAYPNIKEGDFVNHLPCDWIPIPNRSIPTDRDQKFSGGIVKNLKKVVLMSRSSIQLPRGQTLPKRKKVNNPLKV